MKVRSSERGFTLIDTIACLAVISIVMAVALPSTASGMQAFRLKGDAQAVNNMVSLAKMRAVSGFTRARIHVDRTANRFFVESWNREDLAWQSDGSFTATSPGVTFGFGDLDAPPPDTQAEIAFSPACLDDGGVAIANTACITFNSRGVPVDNFGAPTGGNALYVTDGVGVYATTVTATPLVRFWWSPAQTVAWVRR